jgi:hypothetical protein
VQSGGRQFSVSRDIGELEAADSTSAYILLCALLFHSVCAGLGIGAAKVSEWRQAASHGSHDDTLTAAVCAYARGSASLGIGRHRSASVGVVKSADSLMGITVAVFAHKSE